MITLRDNGLFLLFLSWPLYTEKAYSYEYTKFDLKWAHISGDIRGGRKTIVLVTNYLCHAFFYYFYSYVLLLTNWCLVCFFCLLYRWLCLSFSYRFYPWFCLQTVHLIYYGPVLYLKRDHVWIVTRPRDQYNYRKKHWATGHRSYHCSTTWPPVASAWNTIKLWLVSFSSKLWKCLIVINCESRL